MTGDTGATGLRAHVRVALGSFDVDVPLEADGGGVVALVGPNGAGKTTVLRALAGLQPLDGGHVTLDGEVLEDAAAGFRQPPEQRRVGVVFQDHRLFPHLDALGNVAFGLRSQGAGSTEAERRARGWLERVGLAGFERRRPSDLSGGQVQLVALARALAVAPRLLLLDEPFSALDAAARVDIRRALRRHLDSFAGVRLLVTHDPLEAMVLARRLVVIEGGRVTQTGTPQEVSARPRSRYVAQLVGMNLFAGEGHHDQVRLRAGAVLAAPDAGIGPVFAVVHPRAVALHRSPPHGTPRNVWPGTVGSLDAEGGRVRVQVTGRIPVVAEVTPAAVSELALAEGGPVWVSVKAAEISVYPA